MEATTQTNTTIVNYIIILMFMVKGMLRRFVDTYSLFHYILKFSK